MRWLQAAILIVLVGPGTAHSQTAYRDAVLAYQQGKLDAAAATLAGWSESDLKRASDRTTTDLREWRFAEAAAMLHTEFALLGEPDTLKTILFHSEIAERIVRSLKAPSGLSTQDATAVPPGTGDLTSAGGVRFQEVWYCLMARFFFLHFSPSVAQQFIDRGLRLAKNSAPLTMLAGMSEEIREDRAAVIPNYSSPMSRLTYAESFYRRALTLDPHLTEARLRLGRVLFLRNQREPARHELVSVTQISRDPALLYLAHLFQGALAQSVSDFQSARREYQLALELGPRYQTASIALSFVEHLAGRESAAREVMAQWQESRRSPSDESDPWWDYRSGRIDLDALAWLRAQVHQ